MKIVLGTVISLFLGLCLMGGYGSVHAANPQMPLWPTIYSGAVTSSAGEYLEGFQIVGRAGDYSSVPVLVKNSRYAGLAVGPSDRSLIGSEVGFYLLYPDGTETGIVAAEKHIVNKNLSGPTLVSPLDLTFEALPLPTPTPTAVPTATPIPSPTPVPTATPIPTATPVIVDPSIYSGLIIVPGILDYEGSLTARIGPYESFPVPVVGGKYANLVIDVADADRLGQKISFYLDGFEARTGHVLKSGERRQDLDLIFVQIPQVATPAVVSEKSVIVATVTAETPIARVSATSAKPAVSKETSVKSFTPTPVVVVKEVVVVATPTVVVAKGDEGEEADDQAEAAGSGCGKPQGSNSDIGGAVNALAFLGPVLGLAVLRKYRHSKREWIRDD